MSDTWTLIDGYTASDYSDTLVFEVDSSTKELEKIAGQTLVAGEENSQYIRIQMDRYWDGIDISSKTIQVMYALAGEYYGTSDVVSAESTDNAIQFGWIVPAEACCVQGTLLFCVVITDTDYALKTQIASTIVYKTIDFDSEIPEPTREAWYVDFQNQVNATLENAETTLAQAQNAVSLARSYVGAPLKAETASDMIDTSRIYVYVGSEDGYQYGYWYYYDTANEAWSIGGVYNAVAVETDDTLSISGTPADAKATGDAISELSAELTEFPQSFDTLDEDADLYVTDENGNAIVEFSEGNLRTKNFDSANITERVSALEEEEAQSYIPDIMETDASDADLDVTDSHGNVVARFAQGHIQTKNFNSEGALERISNAEDDISDANKEITFMRRVRTRMCFGAHNGAEYYAPECTIPAYRIAGQQGWEWAWIAGIYFSSDGSMYVLHDGTVDRTTDGTGSITDMTDAQIDALNITQTGSGYNLSDFDPSELKIPTFEQVLQQCVRYGMKMVIRLHSFPGYSTDEEKAVWDNFVDLLESYNVQSSDISCYVGNGGMATICRNLFGNDVEISTFLGRAGTAQDFLDWFSERSIVGNRAAILSMQNTNLSAVKLLHQNGIRVYTYDSALESDASNCASMGVDIFQNSKIYKLTE